MKQAMFWTAAAVVVITGAVFVTRTIDQRAVDPPLNVLPTAAGVAAARGPTANVAMVDGKQVVEILAKGNYSPRVTIAQAGVPTVIQLRTKETLDCTLSVNIPSLRVRRNLPTTGVVAVNVPAQAAGSTLEGVCSMGMYGFTVRFV